jgi:hypothetical protein
MHLPQKTLEHQKRPECMAVIGGSRMVRVHDAPDGLAAVNQDGSLTDERRADLAAGPAKIGRGDVADPSPGRFSLGTWGSKGA